MLHRIAFVATLSLVAAAAGARVAVTVDRADACYRSAMRRLERPSIESRRAARDELEQAVRLAPARTEYSLALGRVYLDGGFRHEAQRVFQRVVRAAPKDVRAHSGLAEILRRDYLDLADTDALAGAIDEFETVAALDPDGSAAGVAASVLLLEHGREREALRIAARAFGRAPESVDAMLALAVAAVRIGRLHEADSLFALAAPRLPAALRARFDDVTPLLRAGAPHDAAAADALWDSLDPEPATPENEARIEYRARVAQAYALFFDARKGTWDRRGEVYARYGPPARIIHTSGMGGAFPMGIQYWLYPALGMRVDFHDRALSGRYQFPLSLFFEYDPRPDPVAVARGGALVSGGGRGTFPRVPTACEPLAMAGQFARFATLRGARVVIGAEFPGEPGEAMAGEWAVRDSANTIVAHGRVTPTPSACDPLRWRVAEAACELAPGRYTVGVSVTGDAMRRGAYRAELVVDPPTTAFAISDVMLTCGTPDPGDAAAVRPAPGARRIVAAGAPVTAYFELRGLAPDAAGRSRFEYTCIVRPVDQDRRFWLERMLDPPPRRPEVRVMRDGASAGGIRRQFVSVPLAAAASGAYRLDIVARDLTTGAEATAGTPFVRAAAATDGDGYVRR